MNQLNCPWKWMSTLLLLGLIACGAAGTDGPTCAAGATEACTCENGNAGAKSCALDGSEWLPCVCDGSPPPDTSQPDTGAPDTMGPDPEWQTPPTTCAAPSGAGDDPLGLTASKQPNGQSHLLEVTVDAETDVVYATGIPALYVGKMNGNNLEPLGQLNGKYEHLELLGDGIVALSSRGKSNKNSNTMTNQGLHVYDASNPNSIQLLKKLTIDDAGGMARDGDWLYLLSHDGILRTLDISDRSNPVVVHELTELKNPWSIVLVDGLAYVADNTLGLVIVDRAQPDNPSVLDTIPTAGGAQDLVIGNDHLFIAVGTAGVDTFSLANPAAPTSLGSTELGGAVISVSFSDDRLWASNQERVLVVDAATPGALQPLAFEDTPSWAMHVHAVGNRAYVTDWKTLSVYDFAPTGSVAQADPSKSEIYFTSGTTEMSLTIANRGSADLTVAGMSADDPRITIQMDTLTVGPGEEATVLLTYDDDGGSLDTSLCVATNDPNAPIQQVHLATTSSGSSVVVGEAAPNFILPDTDGNYHELAEQQGHPVVLIFFATW